MQLLNVRAAVLYGHLVFIPNTQY